MFQLIFFALFMITIIAGVFTYFVPAQQKLHSTTTPYQLMADNGADTAESLIHKVKDQQVNVSVRNGIMQIKKNMDVLALEQDKFLDTFQDQQQILKNAGKNVSDIMLVAQQAGVKADNDNKDSKDILQLKAVASQIQDEQKLLVNHGQDLVALNNHLAINRQWVADQVEYADAYTEAALLMLRKRNAWIKEQTAEFFDRMYAYNQEMRDAMDRMRQQLRDLANAAYENKAQEQMIRDRIRSLLEKERDELAMQSEIEERSKDLWKDVQQKIIDSKDFSNDAQQRAQDLIDEDKQKAEDQEATTQQRIADQLQRIRDQQEDQKMKNF